MEVSTEHVEEPHPRTIIRVTTLYKMALQTWMAARRYASLMHSAKAGQSKKHNSIKDPHRHKTLHITIYEAECIFDDMK